MNIIQLHFLEDGLITVMSQWAKSIFFEAYLDYNYYSICLVNEWISNINMFQGVSTAASVKFNNCITLLYKEIK